METLPELLFAGGGLGVLAAGAAVAGVLHRRRPAAAPPTPTEDRESAEATMRIALPVQRAATTIEPDPAADDHERTTDVEPLADPEIAWLKGVTGVEGEFLLGKPVNVVGRSRDCDIVLDVPTVSRRHCEIRWTGRGWDIVPTGLNGTAVGDHLLPPGAAFPLDNEDVVRLGRSVALQLIRPRPVLPAAGLTFRAAGRSDIGNRRHNEDAFLAAATVVGVADGVGGRPAGRVASEICIEVLRAADATAGLDRAAQAMNDRIRRRGASDPLTSGMASTLDAVRLEHGDGSTWLRGVHVGDGYTVLQQSDGSLAWKTRPHTYAEALVAAGQLDTTEGDQHPDRSRLLRAIGVEESVRADVWQERARPGQRVVIFTDGLYTALGHRRIAQALDETYRLRPDRVCERLIELALRTDGNRDNITVVVADVADLVGGDDPEIGSSGPSGPIGS